MIVKFHKNFEKKFKKLDKSIKDKVIEKIAIFSKDPLNIQLKNHALGGSLKGKRSFSITGDYRIIFEEIDNYVLVIMLDVGSHNQVY